MGSTCFNKINSSLFLLVFKSLLHSVRLFFNNTLSLHLPRYVGGFTMDKRDFWSDFPDFCKDIVDLTSCTKEQTWTESRKKKMTDRGNISRVLFHFCTSPEEVIVITLIVEIDMNSSLPRNDSFQNSKEVSGEWNSALANLNSFSHYVTLVLAYRYGFKYRKH